MERCEAINLVRSNVNNNNLVKHMIAVGAIMKELAHTLGEDEKKWELTGILHDLDYEETKENLSKHGLRSAEMLEGVLDRDALEAIKTHAYELNNYRKPESKIEIALIASDAVSGLVIATALMMPDKKLASVSLKSLRSKFKQKAFAKGANRDNIRMCEQLRIDLDSFLDLSLRALQAISDELGL